MYINLKTIDLCPGQGGISKPETTFSVEPSTTAQTIIPEEGYVFSSGTVAAVDSTIDSNIVPGNIKTGISILGVQGTVNPQKPEEHLVQNITTNGSHTYSPTPGSVYSDATITVAVPMKVEETFNVTPTTSAQTILPESGHVFSSGVVSAVTSSIDQNIVPGNIKSGVTILGVAGTVNPQKPEETFSVAPRTTDLIVTPQEGYVFSSGVVTAVTSEIDANIVPENIRTGVSILGVTGNVSPAKSEETFTVNPSTQAQTITPQSGYTFSSGTVAAVDSTIDQNIVSSNIKDGVTILGVLGTYTGGSSKNYSDYDGRINGLADLGWDEDSIGYAESNIQHYSWENSDYVVTQANKDLYGVFSYNNKNSYSSNTDMVYVPMFDVPSVQSLDNLFQNFTYIKDIPILDFTGITYMQRMFSGCSSLRTIPMLETGHLVSLGQMFQYCSSLESIPKIDTGSNVNFDNFFEGCSKLKSIPDLDTSSAVQMENMFYGCTSLTTIPLLDTSSVTRMRQMFRNCSSLITIPLLDTSSVTNMGSMFFGCSSLTTVPALDTSNVTNMASMFNGCTSLTNVNGIDFSSLTDAPGAFLQNAGSTVTRFIVNGKIDFTWNGSNGLDRLTAIDFDSVKSILQAMSRTTNANAKTMKLNRLIADQNGELAALIADCRTKGWTIIGLAIPTGDPVIHYTSKDGNIVAPYAVRTGFTVVSNVYQDGVGTITFNTYPSEIWQYMYKGKSQLDTIEIPDEVTSIGYAPFADGCGITRITIPSNVISIESYAFSGATSLVEVKMESAVPPTMGSGVFQGHNANLVIRVPLSAVNTYKAASGWSEYASLIVGYATLQDIGWDAQSISYYGNQMVTSANAALYGVVDKDNKDSYNNNTDMEYVPMFNTTGVTAMNNYFDGFSHIKGIPILDTSAVEDIEDMFSGCSSLTTIPLLDTSSVMYMYGMFTGCSSLTSIPLLNTSVVEDMNSMFSGCSSLTTVPALDTSSVTNFESMFDGCTSLTTVNGIDFSSMTVAPSQFMYNAGSTVTHFIVNGKIDFTWNGTDGLNNLTNIDFDSVKSILQAMSRATNADAKTMKLSRTIRDQNGQLAALKTQCESKGWTITGLTITSGGLVVEDDPTIEIGDGEGTVSPFGEYCYIGGDPVTVNGIPMNELRLNDGDTLVGYYYYDIDESTEYFYDTDGNQLNPGGEFFDFDEYLLENGIVE